MLGPSNDLTHRWHVSRKLVICIFLQLLNCYFKTGKVKLQGVCDYKVIKSLNTHNAGTNSSSYQKNLQEITNLLSDAIKLSSVQTSLGGPLGAVIKSFSCNNGGEGYKGTEKRQ